MSEVTFRAGSGRPCPVCGTGSKGCSATDDGLHFCRGKPGAGWCLVLQGPDTAGFCHYRRTETRLAFGGKSPPPPVRPAAADWAAVAARYAANLDDGRKKQLASALGVPVAALISLGQLGFNPDDKAGPCWTIPERNPAGEVVGILRRLVTPPPGGKNKLAMAGGRRGLILPEGWRDRSGPVFLVEGPSDALAATAAGLAAVGRPSDRGGVGDLAGVLRDIPSTRPLIVVGENDAKADGSWPGRDGAEAVAGGLADRLRRPVSWAMTPDGAKDVRAWLTGSNWGSTAWNCRGSQLAAALAAAQVVRAPEGPADEAVPPVPSEPRFTFISSADLAGGDYRPTWLVPGVLVKGQPGVIAGPSKSMKTSILIDLGVSLAAGRPFIGEFEVPKPFKVAVVSGESGAHTIQETARRVCKARGVDLAALDRLQWCFDLPTLANVGVMAEFAEGLTRLGAEVVIIDPLYLALGGDIDHANMFEMGAALRGAAEVLLKAGVTPILVHHANRQLKVGEQMELTHLAYSGLEQFARQFLLVNRREPYRSDGIHDLWLRAGGSAGHGGLWGVHIEEGLTDGDFGGREWNVTVQDTTEVHAGRADQREAARRDAGRTKVRKEGTELLDAIDAITAGGRPAATMTRIRTETGFSANKIRDIAKGLIEEGHVEEYVFEAAGGKGSAQKAVGYRRPPR